VDRTRSGTGDVLEDVVVRAMMCGGGFVDDFLWWSGDDVFLPIGSAELSGPWMLAALVKEPLVIVFFPSSSSSSLSVALSLSLLLLLKLSMLLSLLLLWRRL